MSPKALSITFTILGIVIAAFCGTAFARDAGVGDKSWLMMAFGLGILLINQGHVLSLKQQVHDLQRRITAGEA